MHIFYLMSKSNIFGPLFTEVDTTGALQILAYIKPQIVGRVQDRVNPSEAGADSRSGPGHAAFGCQEIRGQWLVLWPHHVARRSVVTLP